MAEEERMCLIERNGDSKLKQKLSTAASQDNDIKADVVVVLLSVLLLVTLYFLMNKLFCSTNLIFFLDHVVECQESQVMWKTSYC